MKHTTPRVIQSVWYTCDLCEEEIQLHTGQKPTPCPICGKETCGEKKTCTRYVAALDGGLFVCTPCYALYSPAFHKRLTTTIQTYRHDVQALLTEWKSAQHKKRKR